MPNTQRHALEPARKSSAGATSSSVVLSRLWPGRAAQWMLPETASDGFFLPDFCQPKSVLAVVLVAELLAAALVLARGETTWLTDLAHMSLFVQWLALTGAAVLCYSRPWLRRLSVPGASVAVFAILLCNTAAVTFAAHLIAVRLAMPAFGALDGSPGPGSLLGRTGGIAVVVIALLLRYFFVAHQWQQHVKIEARSRIDALQARIRPHFLFNSMNTIAALTRSDPRRAEEAVEDLADLFRATLGDADRPLRLKEELELSRIYQRIEALRLGERLHVEWHVAALPMRALVPGLTVQPLLENAIYHGIEPFEQGGTVLVEGRVEDDDIVLSVTNPVAEAVPATPRTGNRIALDNIRQRLQLAYGRRGRLAVAESAGRYEVTIRFPYTE
jgi:two-component system sensor histidine kinase AlgZ